MFVMWRKKASRTTGGTVLYTGVEELIRPLSSQRKLLCSKQNLDLIFA